MCVCVCVCVCVWQILHKWVFSVCGVCVCVGGCVRVCVLCVPRVCACGTHVACRDVRYAVSSPVVFAKRLRVSVQHHHHHNLYSEIMGQPSFQWWRALLHLNQFRFWFKSILQAEPHMQAQARATLSGTDARAREYIYIYIYNCGRATVRGFYHSR